MQQFVVPQFLDVEDKVIGPITTRQFVIMLSGFIIIGILYKIFDFSLFIVSGLLVFALSGVFAFLRINGRPFHFFVLNLYQTLKRPKLRIWRHLFRQSDEQTESRNSGQAALPLPEKHYTASRLAELSLIVDTKGAYQGEKGDNEVRVERGV